MASEVTRVGAEIMLKNLATIIILAFISVCAFADRDSDVVQCPGISAWLPHEPGKDFELTEDGFDRGWRYSTDDPKIDITGLLPAYVMVSSYVSFRGYLYCDYTYNNTPIISIYNAMTDVEPNSRPENDCKNPAAINAQTCTWKWQGHST